MKCIICGCTDEDCSECIEVTGRACSWAYMAKLNSGVVIGLCTACKEIALAERKRRLGLKKEVRAQRQREDKRRAR